jgi:LacI family transcriptional regulator
MLSDRIALVQLYESNLRHPMKNRVTMRDVARLSGVHVSTVSRVLNSDAKRLISPEVSKRVLKASARLGFRANQFGSSLRTRRSHAVGVITTDVSHPMFPPMLQPIEDVLLPNGYVPILANSGYRPERQIRILDMLLSRQIDGVILSGQHALGPLIEHCHSWGIPAVLVMGQAAALSVSAVDSDNMWGAQLVLAHLTSLGHRRIGYVAGPADRVTSLPRREAFDAAMSALGLKSDPRLNVTAAESTPSAGEAACARLLALKRRPTAIVASNDFIAVGCCDAIRSTGLTCPADVSVVGYNDLAAATLVRPELTTVRISFADIGREAAQLLLRKMEGESINARQVLLRPELVIRGSTAPPHVL